MRANLIGSHTRILLVLLVIIRGKLDGFGENFGVKARDHGLWVKLNDRILQKNNSVGNVSALANCQPILAG